MWNILDHENITMSNGMGKQTLGGLNFVARTCEWIDWVGRS